MPRSVFFFKQKTAYEMRISDWSSDVCSSDLPLDLGDYAVGVDRKAMVHGDDDPIHLGLPVHERGVDDGGDAAEPPFLGVAGKAERVPLACSAPARLLRGLVDHGQKALVASQPRAAHGDRVPLARDRELVDPGYQN